jgi:Asp-tRNA(Asn)/Glu-tRNA(Gln) amidotransferase A subunit family amidase
MNPDFLRAGACEQARWIASGQLSAAELMAAQYAAIERRNPDICALIAVAAPQAATGQSALAGTSFGAKDNIDVAGLPSAGGLRALARTASADAPVVARLRAAGLHCVGKLNMHPLALGATNHNPDYGDCFHPLHPGHTPGGSSGGSAAAVAAGLCSIALGSDTMGSVRIPAAYCGVVGFKPSHESLGLAGVLPLCRLLDHVGVLARRVEDIEAAMRIMAPQLPSPGPRSSPWRVGIVRDAQAKGASDSVLRAYEGGIGRVSGRQEIEWVDVSLAPVALDAVRRAGLLLCEAELHAVVAPLLAQEPCPLPADLQAMMRFIEGKSALDLGRAISKVAQAGDAMEALTAGLDALILPTAPQTSFPMDGPVPANQADFTALANANGAPAISLPLPVAAGEFAVGLQLIGHRGHDLALLEIAAWMESALNR